MPEELNKDIFNIQFYQRIKKTRLLYRHHFMSKTVECMKREKGESQQTKIGLSILLWIGRTWWIFHELLSIGLRFEKKAEIYISCVSLSIWTNSMVWVKKKKRHSRLILLFSELSMSLLLVRLSCVCFLLLSTTSNDTVSSFYFLYDQSFLFVHRPTHVWRRK